MKNSGLAVASLVLGIVAVVVVLLFGVFFGWISAICAIVGLILGIVAKGQIKSSNGQIGGNGMALAGIILSVAGLLLWILSMVACAALFSAL